MAAANVTLSRSRKEPASRVFQSRLACCLTPALAKKSDQRLDLPRMPPALRIGHQPKGHPAPAAGCHRQAASTAWHGAGDSPGPQPALWRGRCAARPEAGRVQARKTVVLLKTGETSPHARLGDANLIRSERPQGRQPASTVGKILADASHHHPARETPFPQAPCHSIRKSNPWRLRNTPISALERKPSFLKALYLCVETVL